MIFKDAIKLKENITSFDISNVVETVLDFILRSNDDGTMIYSPYFMLDGLKFAIIALLIDGVEVEETDEVIGMGYANTDVAHIVDDFMCTDKCAEIVEYINDVAEFRKQEYIHRSSELNKLLMKALDSEIKVNGAAYKFAMQQIALNEKSEEILKLMTPEEIAELNKKIASGELNPDGIANLAIEKYMATDKHDENLIQAIDEKNKKIQELKAYKDAHPDQEV